MCCVADSSSFSLCGCGGRWRWRCRPHWIRNHRILAFTAHMSRESLSSLTPKASNSALLRHSPRWFAANSLLMLSCCEQPAVAQLVSSTDVHQFTALICEGRRLMAGYKQSIAFSLASYLTLFAAMIACGISGSPPLLRGCVSDLRSNKLVQSSDSVVNRLLIVACCYMCTQISNAVAGVDHSAIPRCLDARNASLARSHATLSRCVASASTLVQSCPVLSVA